jgi:phosphomevalonate kinase
VKRLSVPGNLLLLGEYAVLEPGGLGLAIAPDRRITIEVADCDTLAIQGILGTRHTSWTEGSFEENPFVSSVVDVCKTWFRSKGIDAPTGSIRIDSSQFYSSKHGKLGYGSSAAVSVGLTASLLELADTPDEHGADDLFTLALEGHRRAQGGRGSGYDIATSLHGCTGLFSGGDHPKWTPVKLSWLPHIYLFQGENTVSTSNSVQRYQIWKEENPHQASDFLEESNHSVRGFASAKTWTEATTHFLRCKELGLQIGKAIGVPAEIESSSSDFSGWCKALGAGNEIGALLSQSPVHDHDLQEIEIAEGGVRWEV